MTSLANHPANAIA